MLKIGKIRVLVSLKRGIQIASKGQRNAAAELSLKMVKTKIKVTVTISRRYY